MTLCHALGNSLSKMRATPKYIFNDLILNNKKTSFGNEEKSGRATCKDNETVWFLKSELRIDEFRECSELMSFFVQNSHELAGFIVLQNLYSLPGVYTPSRKIGWAARPRQ